MTENRNLEGVLVSSIPFTHPTHVPQILVYLRQQALFNSLLASCVRPMARQDPENTVMFEVSALSWQHLSVSLEHPFEETMATAELDLSDISALKCKLYGVSMKNSESSSELAGKVLQRCLSIPVTMRTLIKTWEGGNSASSNSMNSNGRNYNVNLGPGRDQNGHNGAGGMPDFSNGDVKIKQEPGLNGNGGIGRQQSSQQSFLEAGAENSIGFPSFSGHSDTTTAMLNPLQLGALLGQAKNSSAGLINPVVDRQSKKVRKRKGVEGGLWRSPKRKGEEMGEILLESSSSDSTPLGTPTGRENQNELRTPTPTSAASLGSGLDLSNLDPADILGTDKSSDYDIMDNDNEIVEVHDLQDVEELLKRDRKLKKRDGKKSPNIFEENKNLVPPSVSITPISSSGISQPTNYNSVLTGMGLERRPGIEIIPIASSPQTSLPSSITITPIAGPASKNLTDERRDRKSSKNKTEDKNKLEKKRKRKREDSPMGPPDKLPLKPDPLSKPVSVSIKPTESPPNLTTRPSSPAATFRKFSPSPTHTSPLALVGKSSPTLKQPVNKPIQSPKHSPVYNSPKHTTIPASVSPKHGTSSPKHGSSASAGKPSMSALKSAANSPSSKSSDGMPKAKSSSKDSNRDKDRKASSLAFGGSGHQSPKMKSSSAKLKQLDLNPSAETPPSLPSSGGSTPPSGGSDIGKSATAQQQARNRKGSLSAVIDKLKNAQHCTEDGNGGSKASQKDRASSNKVSEGKSGSKTPVDTKNPAEYMVKHSSEMKITINKKGTKDSKSSPTMKSSSGSSSSSGNGSPKTHTGLKPGVNSGPASKKPQQQVSPKLPGSSGSGNSGSKASIAGQKVPSVQKSASGSSSGGGLLAKGISAKSSGSPKLNSSGATDLSSRNRDKPRPPKSGDKNIFGSKSSDVRRTSSPSALREESESERAFKLLAHASMSNLPNLPPQLVVEGLMKQLDTKFQIPKLSARTNADADKKPVEKLTITDSTNNRTTDVNKILDSLSNKTETTTKIQSAVSLSNAKPTEDRREVQSKPDNLCTASISISLGNSSPSLIMPPPAVSPHDSDVPTNLSMQPADTESREMKDVVSGTGSRPSQFLNCAPLNASKDETTPEAEPISAQKSYPIANSGTESLNLSTKPADAALNKYKDEKKPGSVSIDGSIKPPPPASSCQDATEVLLDFSTPKEVPKLTTVPERALAQATPVRRNTPPPPPPPPTFPPSPSVSVHIVKSPAPSPRVVPSPHSASPCITDDELMDEALVGIGK